MSDSQAETYVQVKRDGPIAFVQFDRKKNLNAFDGRLILELTDVARSFHDDLETRAVVLTGSRDYFSAGADLVDLSARTDSKTSELERRHVFSRGVRLCQAWEAMPQITVAAIERLAVGAGVALPLACDWRVMGESAYLWVPEVKIGVNLQWGALPRLINLVGPARAKRICILCERMNAETALDWGLIDEIAADGQALEKATELARRAAGMPPIAVRMIKEAVNATATTLNRVASYADADQSMLSAATEDARAARDRFNES
ncbi:MAG TPA: enoyl-CoA hydratase/isomerase family protein [Deltaproteobacteria bacterium]|nr:enoyl-CoA hydratase/isomerase family protein [Deltaproteobacteria bacterium]